MQAVIIQGVLVYLVVPFLKFIALFLIKEHKLNSRIKELEEKNKRLADAYKKNPSNDTFGDLP